MDKNKLIQAATKFVQKGQFDKAIKEYQRIVEEDPKDIRILQKIGELHQKRGDSGQAAQTFIKVAEAYSNDGFFLKAAAVYKQVLKINPGLLATNAKLAELYQQLGLMSDALQQYQILATAYEQQGDIQSSLGILKKLCDLDQDNVANRIRLAESYSREGQNDQAIAEFNRVAAALKQNNRAEEYVKVAERLAFLDPQNMSLCRELANVYLARGDTKRALAKLQICFKADPRDVETLTLLARAFKDLGQTAKTVSVYKELAKIHSDADRVDDEHAVWKEILALAPGDPDAQAWRTGEDRAGAPAMEPARPPPAARVRASPSTTVVAAAPAALGADAVPRLLTEMEVYVKYGLHAKAAEHLKKILAIAPGNLTAHEKAKDLYLTLGDKRRAADELVESTRLSLEAGDEERARRHMNELRSMAPDHPSLLELGAALGQPVEVAEIADDAILVEASDDDVLVSADPEELVEDVSADELLDDGQGSAPGASVEDELDAADDEPLVAATDDGDGADGAEELALATADDAEVLVDEPLESAEALVDEDAGDDRPFDESLARNEVDTTSEADVVAAVSDVGVAPYGALPFDDSGLEDVSDDHPPEEATTIAMLPMAGMLDTASEAGRSPTPLPVPIAGSESARRRVTEPAAAPPSKARSEAAPPLGTTASAGAAAPRATTASPPARRVPQPAEPMAPSPPPPPAVTAEPEDGSDEGAEEFEEANFFIEQGLCDEASEIIEGLRTRSDSAPGLRSLVEDLERRLAAARGEAEPAEGLDAPLEAALPDEAESAPEPAPEDFQYPVEDVLAEFKKGVERTVGPEDVETHYDLGIAYKEMGLLDEAVGEFELAANGASGKPRQADCLAMIGLCHAAKSRLAEAVETFEKALDVAGLRRETTINLYYEIGAAREGLGDAAGALDAYEKVAALDSKYRNVGACLTRLRPAKRGAKIGYL